MSSPWLLSTSLAPFLYPFTKSELRQAALFARRLTRPPRPLPQPQRHLRRRIHTQHDAAPLETTRLNPTPDDFSASPFKDHCTITIESGSGGNGCVSFLREKFIANGPPNGGEGGIGGNIYIQAIAGETSLHKIARRREVKAGRGRNGQGGNRNGQRGSDVVITVPVGTVVRELGRLDPVSVEEEEFAEEAMRARQRRLEEKYKRRQREESGEKDEEVEENEDTEDTANSIDLLGPARRDKFVMYPGEDAARLLDRGDFRLPQPRRSNLTGLAAEAPISLDLDSHMETPRLLAPGAMGGLGNPSFVSKTQPLPKIATKGDGGVKIVLHMELKLLADVGLVGLPNAGKSTLLRAISNSRARVGNWAFTTLAPNIGTVVLDDFKGRSKFAALGRRTGRTNFTVADIPGVIEDAHLDKGLGLSFLRHIERARILAFVVDLAAGDAVTALKALWTEVSEYENLSSRRGGAGGDALGSDILDWQPTAPASLPRISLTAENADELILQAQRNLPPLELPPMSSKPWFVVATKADLPSTQENYLRLQRYLADVQEGREEHPGGKEEAWRERVYAVPVSGIRGEGVERIAEVVVELLDA